ncbi:MAG: hypothetical protein WDN25_14880 [Acetobacteraceae bacterium]
MSPTRLPRQQAPALICDCHIFGPYDRLPLDAGRAYHPPAALLLDRFVDWVPDAALRHRILLDNPARLYGF